MCKYKVNIGLIGGCGLFRLVSLLAVDVVVGVTPWGMRSC
jgi:purine nucleoside phosphorylase